jgi:predicted nucleic acid-binding protein
MSGVLDSLPSLASSKDVTDAHLVRLASSHGLKLATLDQDLCNKPWSRGIAENPL